ncbi:PRC-barrel domain-containing protein [Cribrihabitans neustonicus]|uniref:PRC-barrel domain-containing protein n=1 Tax=Cribrihabitans neustonicus TaxID=1429085 RepID=UPI003B5BDE17
MKNLLLSTSLLIITSAVPAFAAGTDTDASGDASAEIKIPATEGDAAAGAEVEGSVETEMETETEQALEETGEAVEDAAESAETAAEEAAESAEAGAEKAMDEAEAATDEMVGETSEAMDEAATETGEAMDETAAETEEMMDDAGASAEASAKVIAIEDLTAEELTGTRAYDANDEHVGEVSEVILTADGKVEGVVVDLGGFLGIGEKPVKLTMDDIEINEVEGDLRVRIMMTEEQMEALPEYEGT